MPQDAQDLNAATQMDLSSEHDVFENRPETIESRASDSGLLVPSSACPFDSTVNGLLDLRAPQLLAMLPPLVPDVELCSSMRRPTVPVGTRLSLLDNQAHAWADDEVWWHLSAIALPKPKETAVLDPLIAHTWLTAAHQLRCSIGLPCNQDSVELHPLSYLMAIGLLAFGFCGQLFWKSSYGT